MAKAHVAFAKVSLKRCTQLAATSDKAYQLLAHGQVVLSGYSGFFHHYIAEILLKVALNTQ
jgi:hypothetical protein